MPDSSTATANYYVYGTIEFTPPERDDADRPYASEETMEFEAIVPASDAEAAKKTALEKFAAQNPELVEDWYAWANEPTAHPLAQARRRGRDVYSLIAADVLTVQEVEPDHRNASYCYAIFLAGIRLSVAYPMPKDDAERLVQRWRSWLRAELINVSQGELTAHELVERMIQMHELRELWEVIERRYVITFLIWPPRGLVHTETLWSSEGQLTPWSPESTPLPRGEVAYAAAANFTMEWRKTVLDSLMAGFRRFAVSNDLDRKRNSIQSPARTSAMPAMLPEAGQAPIQHTIISVPRYAPGWQRKRWPQLHPDARVVPFGKRPRRGVDAGCGNATCQDCYEQDPDPIMTLLMADDTTGPDFDVDLAGFAARAAAEQLVNNWVCAVGDGTPLEELLLDVDETVRRLLQFKIVLAHLYGSSQP